MMGKCQGERSKAKRNDECFANPKKRRALLLALPLALLLALLLLLLLLLFALLGYRCLNNGKTMQS